MMMVITAIGGLIIALKWHGDASNGIVACAALDNWLLLLYCSLLYCALLLLYCEPYERVCALYNTAHCIVHTVHYSLLYCEDHCVRHWCCSLEYALCALNCAPNVGCVCCPLYNIRNVLWSHFCPLAGVLLCEQSHNQEGHSYLHLVNLLLGFAVFVPPCWSCLSLSFTVCYLVGPVCYCNYQHLATKLFSTKTENAPDWKLKQPVRTD